MRSRDDERITIMHLFTVMLGVAFGFGGLTLLRYLGEVGSRSRETESILTQLGCYDTRDDEILLDDLKLSPEWVDRHMPYLSGPKCISLTDSTIPDNHFELLPSKTRFLRLDGSTVTDADLGKLPAWIERVSLARTATTEVGLRELATRKSLMEIDLTGLAVGDEAIDALAASRNLETLNLRNTRVTDASIERLAKMPLRAICLEGTHVTAEGRKRLRELNPGLRLVILESDSAFSSRHWNPRRSWRPASGSL